MKKLFLLLLLLSPRAQAASDGCPAESNDDISMEIEISALYPNPNSGEAEWIELTNLSDDAIDLSLYTLEDATAHPWGLTGTLEETARITGFSFQLNNSNETVILKTVEGAVVDSWTYASSTNGVVLTRDAETAGETSAAPSSTTSSTVTTASQTPSKWPIFSEALPNPEGSDSTGEWIELYNPYGETLTLSGLFLDDSEGGSSAYALSGTMGAESYLLVSVVDSHITLNNDSDHVRLLGINNEVLWDVPYSGGSEGLSYAWFASAYDWTEESTPGTENAWEGDASEESSDAEATSDYQNGDLSDEVTLTEVMPNPEGPDAEEEWIEITNGGDETVNLGNWTIKDKSGTTYTFSDDVYIEPGQSLVLYRTESGISLNNSNESIELSDYNGDTISEIAFEKSYEDESYAEIQIEEVQSTQASTLGLGNQVFSTWQWVTPSPGALNPVWKQVKGEVLEFDGSLLTLFDGVSTWTFKLSGSESTDALLYEVGNTLLVQAASQNGMFEIMHSELVQSKLDPAKKAFPWGILSTVLVALAYGSYEIYRRLQNKKATLAI